jgi:hypothetical protein
MLGLVLQDAGEVLSSVKDITPEKLAENITILVTVGGLYGLFIIACILGKGKDLRQEQDKKVGKFV